MTSSTSLIQSIYNTSQKLFNRQIKNKLDLSELIRLVSKIRSEDLGLEDSQALFKPLDTVPLTYVDVFENSDFSIGIFVLKNGSKIPLHNHPQMFGVLKCVYGQLSISSYSLLTEKNDSEPHFKKSSIIRAKKHPKIILGPEDDAIYLSPTKFNLHEIEVFSEGQAAFLDILAPPYNPSGSNSGDPDIRDCDHFHEISSPNKKDDSVMLRIIEPPDYICEQEDYHGPSLSLSF